MLMYQSAAYHDMAALREIFGLRPCEGIRQMAGKNGISRKTETDGSGRGWFCVSFITETGRLCGMEQIWKM